MKQNRSFFSNTCKLESSKGCYRTVAQFDRTEMVLKSFVPIQNYWLLKKSHNFPSGLRAYPTYHIILFVGNFLNNCIA